MFEDRPSATEREIDEERLSELFSDAICRLKSTPDQPVLSLIFSPPTLKGSPSMFHSVWTKARLSQGSTKRINALLYEPHHDYASDLS